MTKSRQNYGGLIKMDKKEAKKVLEDMIMVSHEAMGNEAERLKTVEAMRVAIACINNSVLSENFYDTDYKKGFEDGFQEALEGEGEIYVTLDNDRSIKEEVLERIRPKGEWDKPFFWNGKTFHKCTNCCISTELRLIDNFCPNCGADMRKGGRQ